MDHDRSRTSSRARARALTDSTNRCPRPSPRRGPAPIMIHPGGNEVRLRSIRAARKVKVRIVLHRLHYDMTSCAFKIRRANGPARGKERQCKPSAHYACAVSLGWGRSYAWSPASIIIIARGESDTG